MSTSSKPPLSDARQVRDAQARGLRMEEREPDAIVAAVVLTLLVHLMVFWLTPNSVVLVQPEGTSFSQPIDILFEEEADPVIQEEQRYVMAPSGVQEEMPEETINFSDRSQVAAQPEEAPPSDDGAPMLEGDELESNRIVQGDPTQSPSNDPPSATAQGESPAQQMDAAPSQPQQIPLPDFLAQAPIEEDGPESAEQTGVAVEPSDLEFLPDELLVEQTSPEDGTGDAEITMPAQSSSEQGMEPRPRMRVQRDTSFGPLRDSARGAIRVGNLAFDARYSEFGEYWSRVAEVIEARWRSILYSTRSIAYSGNRVVVEFVITREGNVENVTITSSSAGRLAETISIDAIAGEAPFFRWTPEMILTMGERTSATITFIY